MMLKEHIVESYGAIRYTIGQGCSGGSIGQHMVAATYPGLLDGIKPKCSFADIWTTAMEVIDCHLLLHYFADVAPQLWARRRSSARSSGPPDAGGCAAWERVFAPTIGEPVAGRTRNDCGFPAEQVYNPETNPGGVRCTLPGLHGRDLGHARPGRLREPAVRQRRACSTA